MQKKIIALAIASALTAPAVAMADTGGNVSVYGQVNLSVDVVNDGKASSTSTNRLVSNFSRLGVKGSEDLGGGLTAVFQAEGTVLPNASGNSFATDSTFKLNRNTYLGLSSAEMGTALVGRHDTPYKISTRGLDVFADNTADNRGLMGNGYHDARLNNVIAYISPAMSGVTVAAATVFGAANAASGDKKGSAVSLAGMYSLDNIYATLAYQKVKLGTAGSGSAATDGSDFPTLAALPADTETKGVKLGGSYTMDAIKVGAVVEKITVTPVSGSETTNNNFYLAGKYSLNATDAVKLAYAKKGNTTGATNNAKQVSVGYDHDMSKRTSVYALYTKVTDEAAQTATTGNDPSTVSIGMKHAF